MQNQWENATDVLPRRKLGLALAGGGFRASLFHLGALHRMAEMEWLWGRSLYIYIRTTIQPFGRRNFRWMSRLKA